MVLGGIDRGLERWRSMSWKVARLIFYVGTLISLGLFLALTIDTHRQIGALTRADRLSVQVVAGKRVWQKYNCNDCHTILGFGGYYAPDLTKVYWKRGAETIKGAIRTPEQFTTWRKMPRLPLSDRELADLVAFLQWTSEIDTHGWPPQDQKRRGKALILGASPGASLFQEKGCFDCHRLNGIGGDLGPDLSRVGSRQSGEVIEKLLADPLSVNPQGEMPVPELTEAERLQLARFLTELK